MQHSCYPLASPTYNLLAPSVCLCLFPGHNRLSVHTCENKFIDFVLNYGNRHNTQVGLGATHTCVHTVCLGVLYSGI
jgi:hypothetical protein